MKKTLLFSAAFFATIAASAQTIVWPSTVNRETKEANLSATVTGSETITATDITLGADIKIGDKDGANAVTAVKNTTGENLQFPSETEGMISWRPINGNVDDAEATADLAEGAGAYIDFTIEEGDINKTFAGMSSFEFDVTKVGTDAIRINVKLIGEGDTNVDTGWLINADNAKSFGDEYQADYDAEAKNKDYPWDEAANGYNPSRNDGSKGVSGGANANGISHVKLAVPAEFAASNPYKVTLRIAIIKCANNKDLAVNAVTFNFGDSTTPVEEEKVYSVIGTLVGNWDVDTDMELVNGVYSATIDIANAGSYEYKIRQDHDWAINWGDNGDGTGVQDGPNFKAELPANSSITITFDPATAKIDAFVVGGVIDPGEEGGSAIIGEIDWTQQEAFNNWCSGENGSTAVVGAEGLEINVPSAGENYWNPQTVVLNIEGEKVADNPDAPAILAEDGQYKVVIVAKHPAGHLQVNLGTWDDGVSLQKDFDVEEAADFHEIVVDFSEGWPADCFSNVHVLWQSGSLPGLSVLKSIQIIDLNATAIKTVKTGKKFEGAIYNLAGQKVNASYKGVVIKDGKKYIQK